MSNMSQNERMSCKIQWVVPANVVSSNACSSINEGVNEGMLLRTFLREVNGISKKSLADIKFKGGKILVNQKEVTVRTTIFSGDRVEVYVPPEPKNESLRPECISLDIHYEDDHLLVINKPHGMPTIPSREHPSRTLANAVMGYYESHHIPFTFHAVNRLDRDTSGLLVVAKHGLAHDQLSKGQRAGKLKRYYLALAEGYVQPREGTIHAPIKRRPSSIIERMVAADGQEAITHYKVINTNQAYSEVEINLETGRTHQIRVHFAHLGHPLLGDDLYGGSIELLARQALHCQRVELIHPFTGKYLHFSAPLPKDLIEVKDKLIK
ncbi:RluA family pseudouridine synthase [Alkalihalophilus marmarensis]|nr:RluA family pseudouridine synthase [Alkalihalophilus marmarensis]MCM3489135.1 RluA family pseudouridine synthase [Alkalihalophilus marmarensis]